MSRAIPGYQEVSVYQGLKARLGLKASRVPQVLMARTAQMVQPAPEDPRGSPVVQPRKAIQARWAQSAQQARQENLLPVRKASRASLVIQALKDRRVRLEQQERKATQEQLVHQVRKVSRARRVWNALPGSRPNKLMSTRETQKQP